MNVRRSALRTRLGWRHADRGFTLVELVIAVALSGVIVGVIVAALITSLNVADTTTNAVRDSTDAGLISAFLYRDAASAGAIDPATALRDPTLGVSNDDTPAGWSGCEQQPDSLLVVRFSWVDHTSALTDKVVVTYAYDDVIGDDGVNDQLTRRICKDGTPSGDVVVGRSITFAEATCQPDPNCALQPTSVLLRLTGSGAGAPTFELTASLRGGDGQAAPDSTNSAPVALLALGGSTPAPCPNLTLDDTQAIIVIGDAFIDGSCVGPLSPIDDDDSMLQPTGERSSIAGIVNPFEGLARPDTCLGAGTPDPIGQSAGPDDVVVYSGPVSIAGPLLFEPGRYVFCAGLDIGAGARVTGSDVLFYIHGGTLTVDSDATVELEASTTGAYAKLLIWVESAPTITINGGPRVSNFRGLIYAPTSTLELTSAVAANIGGLIVKDLIVEGAGEGRARIGLPMPVLAISPTELPPMQVNDAYTADLALTVSGGPSLSTLWKASSLPPGLSIDEITGQITGTPTTSGPFGFIVTAFDDTAAAVSIDYLVSVAPELTITTAALPEGQVGSPYDTTVTATGGTPPYLWSATGLPGGLTIDPGTGRISGTPGTAGPFGVTVTVTDAMTSADMLYTITVKQRPTVTTPSPLPGGQVGTAYSTTITASNGTLPYTWTATGLPAGLTINPATGSISGTPTVVGTFSVNVTVTDAIGAVDTRALSLTISPPAVALTVSGPATLPTGQQNSIYPTTTATAVGGAPPYSWSATGLPAGLAINPASGAISGTPTVVGMFSVTVSVTDSLTTSAQRAYTLEVVPPGCPTTPIVGWLGQYYSNRTLSGTSTLCRDDASIDFSWGSGIPATGLPANDFSVRWTRTQDFAAGNYTFTMGSDDGSRLLIDGVNVYNNWVDQAYPAVPPTFTVPLTAGSHTIVMEFYERGGDARATLTWYSCAGPSAGWIGEYYSNNTLTGTPRLCRDDPAIDFDWGTGSPATGIPTNNFSVRWTRTQDFAAGNYTFSMGSDAGARLYVDNVLVRNDWAAHTYPAVPPTFTVPLTAGSHTVVMEYYELTNDARATLTWYSCAVPATGWSGEYFSNNTLTGTPTLCRNDAAVDFDWDDGSPAPGLPSNNFSVRWTNTQIFTAGNYTFSMGSNAGARLYVDTVLVLDDWAAHTYPAVPPTVTVPLTAGAHTIVMEYYETTGNAQATLSWYSCGVTATGWVGEYYSNNSLSGTPTLCRDDPAIDFDWGSGSPATGIPNDNFSVRWTRTLNLSAGYYTFTMGSDAGARWFINGTLVRSDWGPHGYQTRDDSGWVPAGTYTIVMEYRETNNTNGARALLEW